MHPTLRTITLAAAPLAFAGLAAAQLWLNPADDWFKNRKPWRVADTRHAALVPGGRLVAVAAADKTVRLLRIADQGVERIFDFSLLEGTTNQVPLAVAWSPTQPVLAVAFPGGRILVLDAGGRGVLHRLHATGTRALRFSAAGRFLLAGPGRGADAWTLGYDLFLGKETFRTATPVAADLTRDDRYLFRAEEGGAALRWLDARTGETLRVIALDRLGATGALLSVRVLRDHRVALGFRGEVAVTDRFVERVERRAYTDGLAARALEQSVDGRTLLVGDLGPHDAADRARHALVDLHDGSTLTLVMPAGMECLGLYPGGRYLLAHDGAARATALVRYGDSGSLRP